MSSFLIVGNSN